MLFSNMNQEAQDSYHHVLAHLKQKGIRITESRKAVIAFLIQSKEHPSAENIYKEILPYCPTMSLATVYNNLRVLVEEGFVTEIKRSNDATTYFDFMGHDHLNVICERCGKITDMDCDEDFSALRHAAAQQTGYRITKEVLTIYGVCSECL